MSFPTVRMRRLRKTRAMRRLMQRVTVQPSDLICPVFVDETAKNPLNIPSMPDYFRLPLRKVVDEANHIMEQDVKAVIVFGLPAKKDETGSGAYAANGVVQKAIHNLKKQFGDELVIVTDVCMCEYTTHGHCGILKRNEIQNDATLELLGKIAVSHAEAGADIVGPSAMMDGQVEAIREALDDGGFEQVGIMAYSAKFASCYYSPFRDAAECAPQCGDRKTYQMNYGNDAQEALREIQLDVDEGADIIMVKPALAYLDVISAARQKFNLPIAAYNVSGEYSMVKAAAKMGWIDEKAAILETLTGMKRAGADMIITYFARDAKSWLNQT